MPRPQLFEVSDSLSAPVACRVALRPLSLLVMTVKAASSSAEATLAQTLSAPCTSLATRASAALRDVAALPVAFAAFAGPAGFVARDAFFGVRFARGACVAT